MKNIKLTCSYDICASHQLRRSDWSDEKNREIFGQCARLHGHQYRLEITLEGPISEETGMLINGYEVDRVVQEKILAVMDHHHLNDDIPFFKDHLPTAEWIAVWAFRELKASFPEGVALGAVRIYETPQLFSEYSE